jgi:hypothetical protein
MHRAFDFHLQFSADAAAVGVGDAIPYVGSGRVSVEPAGMGYAGADCSGDRTVGGNPRVIEVIE